MNKIFIIIKREYLDRIRKKTFLISTLLFPLLYLGLIFGSGYLAEKNKTRLKVAVVDSSGYFDKGRIERANQSDPDSASILISENRNVDSLKVKYKEWGYNGFVVIPSDLRWDTARNTLMYFQSEKSYGIPTIAQVTGKINAIWSEIKNEKLGLDSQKRGILEQGKIAIVSADINKTESNAGTASTIGFVSGFLIYMILLIYGSQVMMGVMEEKTNRIAEVMVSSVKPFQLMLGKIVGIGLVALTQFILWITFIFLIYNVTKASGGTMSSTVGEVQRAFTSINIPLILFCFAFYFIGGFFFYASLYAAIGSAINEDMREAQSLSFPVTMLVIFSLFVGITAVNDPNGPLAFWGSIIPLSSPIVMMVRVPFGVPGTVPWWQLGLSMALLIGSFIFSVWISGRIYRTGILMYGKKPSWKELLKWAFRK